MFEFCTMQEWKRRRIYKIWKDWCDRTTFHGFNELQYLTGRVYKAVVWSCLILACFTATFYGIAEILIGYAQSPTAMKFEKEQLSQMELPDLVVCSGATLNVSLLLQDGASRDLVNGIVAAMQAGPELLLTRFLASNRENLAGWEVEMRVFQERNNITSVNQLAMRYHVQCREFVLGCATFAQEDMYDCCEGSQLILDPEYFACHRLSGFGNQTWLGDRAGVSVVFRTSLPDDPMMGTLTSLKDGVAIQPVPILYPHDLYKIKIPGNAIADVSLQWHETNLFHSDKQPCYRLKAHLELAVQTLHTEAACYSQYWGRAFEAECGCTAFSLPDSSASPECGPFAFLSCFILNRTANRRIMQQVPFPSSLPPGCAAFSLPDSSASPECGPFAFLSCFILNRTANRRIMQQVPFPSSLPPGCAAFSLPDSSASPECGPFAFLSCFILNRTANRRIMQQVPFPSSLPPGCKEYSSGALEALVEQKQCLPVCQQIQLSPIVSSVKLRRPELQPIIREGERFENSSLSVVSVYFRSLSRAKNVEIFLYPPETLISNIGGQIGLWMGCSILTVVQAVAYLLRCCQVWLAKRESWTESASVVHNVRRKLTVVNELGRRRSSTESQGPSSPGLHPPSPRPDPHEPPKHHPVFKLTL